MAGLVVGAHVLSTRTIHDRSRSFKVSKDTPGVIVGRSGFFVTTYRVRFLAGRERAIIDRIPARHLRLNPKSIKNKLLLPARRGKGR